MTHAASLKLVPGAPLAARAARQPSVPLDLRLEVERRRGMLGEILGHDAGLEIECLPCPLVAGLSPEALEAVLVGLTGFVARQAAPGGGCMRLSVQQGAGGGFLPKMPRTCGELVLLEPGLLDSVLLSVRCVGLSVSRSRGPVWIETMTEKEPGFQGEASANSRLTLVRSLVEGAGGRVHVVDRPHGAIGFDVELRAAPLPRALPPPPSALRATRRTFQTHRPLHTHLGGRV